MAVFKMWKPVGLTPLQVIEKLKEQEPHLAQVKLTYAGRLDPLAEGVMLILAAEDIKDKERFLNLPKTYEVEVLLGLATDTGDVLGLITEVLSSDTKINEVMIAPTAGALVGCRRQTAPLFSAPGLDGKTFTKEIEVFATSVTRVDARPAATVLELVYNKVKLVRGNFRQAEILADWARRLADKAGEFPVITLTVSCSSGTYMRLLAEELGKSLGRPALALAIKRTKVGDFTESDCAKI